MSVEGIILHHGEAHGVTLHQTRIDYLVTAEHSKQCSLFEFTVAPGFNTGAHYHTKIEEIFYVLEGELDLRCGERTIRGGPGTCVFVPPGAAHAFGNSGSTPGSYSRSFPRLPRPPRASMAGTELVASVRALPPTIPLGHPSLRCGLFSASLRLRGKHERAGQFPARPEHSSARDNAARPAVQSQDRSISRCVQRPMIREHDSRCDKSARDYDGCCLLVHGRSPPVLTDHPTPSWWALLRV
jgi:quercetin dioxygenase-like cupin family protein